VLAQDVGGLAHVPLFLNYGLAFPYSGPSSDGGSAVRLSGSIISTGPTFVIAEGNSWTMEIWYWLPWNDQTTRYLFTITKAAGAHAESLYLQTTDCLGGALPGIGGYNSATLSTPRVWHQAAMTYDNVTLKLVFDGVQLGTAAFVSASTGNYGVAVGTDSAGTGATQGLFAEAALYPTVLTAAQLLAHYNAADFKAYSPVFGGGGRIDPSTGVAYSSSASFAALAADTAGLLSSVRAVYQNAP
jgi:hypothetical protein